MALVSLPRQISIDADGAPRVGAKLHIYEAGTDTYAVIHTTNAYAVEQANPVTSLSDGRFPAFFIDPSVYPTHKQVLKDADGLTISTDDNLPSDTTVSGAALAAALYPLTDAEDAADMVPVTFQYPPGHLWRYLTQAEITDVTEGTLAEDVTEVLQAWGDFCLATGNVAVLPAGSYGTSAELLYTLPGNRTTQCFSLRGEGMGKTRICRIGAQTSMLRIFSNDGLTGGNPAEAQIVLDGFAVCADEVGSSPILRECDGITLQDVAYWTVRNVRTQYCRRNLHIDGAIVGHIEDCGLSDGRVGVYMRNSDPTTQSDNNTITLSGATRINNNLEHGLDIGSASMVYVAQGVNVERNGIAAAAVTISQASPGVITYAASELLVNMPVVFTTDGGLPTGLTAGTTYYVKTVLTADTFTVSATLGGVAINTSSAGSGTHTCTPQTHGVIVRDTCDDLIGVAAVHLQGLWVEANHGGWGIYHEGFAEGVLTIENCEVLQQNAIKCVGGRSIAIRDMVNAANAIYDITSEFGEIVNVTIHTLTDGITYPDFRAFRTNAATHANGRVGSFTGTLTECTTAPTGTVATLQRGKTVTASLGTALVAVSGNTNAPTITGMPAAIRPATTKYFLGVNTDNSVDKVSQNSVASTGVITLNNASSGTFTAANNKGAQFFRGEWEIA